MLAVYKKELKVYFTSILGYVVMAVFLTIAGIVFANFFMRDQNSSDFAGFFMNLNTVFLLIMPILTLRILAEDQKLGTFELLMTSPVTPWEIIIGKFLGIFTFVLIGSTLLLLYPLILTFYTTVEWGAVFAGYLGILFSLSLFISIGMFASSVTDNYVVAAAISYGLVLMFLAFSVFGEAPNSVISAVFKEISYATHYEHFTTGLIQIKDILYFIIGSFIWLYLAKSVVESKSWK